MIRADHLRFGDERLASLFDSGRVLTHSFVVGDPVRFPQGAPGGRFVTFLTGCTAGSNRVRRWPACRFPITLLAEIREVAERPTLAELRARLERRSAVAPSMPPAEAIRAERDRR